MPVLPSYRHQSIDLLCKSIDWFLYEGNTGGKCINADVSKNANIMTVSAFSSNKAKNTKFLR